MNNRELKKIALPYIQDLGLTDVKIQFRLVSYGAGHGYCVPVRNKKAEIVSFIIEIFGGTAARQSTLRRTLAHECYHVYQHVKGLPLYEAPAKRYEKSVY